MEVNYKNEIFLGSALEKIINFMLECTQNLIHLGVLDVTPHENGSKFHLSTQNSQHNTTHK